MTDKQLEKLRSMTTMEIFKKYTPMLMNKKITKSQFDWLIKQGKLKTDIDDIREEFGGELV